MHWIILPFRGEETAKTRLAPHLSDDARRLIARAMFQHVLNVACSAVGARRVLVVTPSSRAAMLARRAGAAVLKDKGEGLNSAAEAACGHLRARGNATAAIVAADLPMVTTEDLVSLSQFARRGSIAIACDKIGSGTNAIALPLSASFRFQYGEDSFERHRMQAKRCGLHRSLVLHSTMRGDVDCIDDLAILDEAEALSTLPSLAHLERGAA